jgi:hypothetical protein
LLPPPTQNNNKKNTPILNTHKKTHLPTSNTKQKDLEYCRAANPGLHGPGLVDAVVAALADSLQVRVA